MKLFNNKPEEARLTKQEWLELQEVNKEVLEQVQKTKDKPIELLQGEDIQPIVRKRGRGRPKGWRKEKKELTPEQQEESIYELGIREDNIAKELANKDTTKEWQKYDPKQTQTHKPYKIEEGIRIYENQKILGLNIGKKIAFKELQDHTLLLIQTNGTIKNMGVQVPDSIFKVKRPEEKDIPRGILLGSSKLLTLPYADGGVKVWIAHELETYPYPRDDIQDNSLFKRLVEKLAMNYKELERDNTMEMIMKYLLPAGLVIAIIIALIYMVQSGKMDYLPFIGDKAKDAANVVV